MTEENNSVKKERKNGDVFEIISSNSSRKRYNNIHSYMIQTGTQLNEDQPFFVTDLADVLWKAQLWSENLPNVFPYYAVKANADPVLIRLFVLLGYGFDCSTEGEIRSVLEAGADSRKVIFAHTVKTRKALKYASSVGVNLMTFDSKEELLKIRKECPTARLVLRLKAENVHSPYNLSIKFGCKACDAGHLLEQAKLLKMDVVGVSFHAGALCGLIETYTSTIKSSRHIFDIAEKLGYKFTIMDIGAGFFGSKEKEEFFPKVTKEIKASLEENFPQGGVEFIAEPGCYYVASSVSLITRIIGKKSIVENGKCDAERQYYVNDGFYGSFKEHMDVYDVRPVALLTDSQISLRNMHKSKIWGQTCCSEDVIQEECLLPDLEEGEFIIWENMGAYRRGLNSAFTLVPLPANRHVFVQNSRLRLDCIPNQQKVIDHISKVAYLVEQN